MRTLTILAGLAVTLLLALAPSASAQTVDAQRSCDQYLTQETAQWFFWSVGGPESDPYNFDPDRNGVACEHLPCPCRYVDGLTPPAPALPIAPATTNGSKRAAAVTSVRAKVVRVVDGKTLRVRGSFETGDVRLLGIATPHASKRHCGATSARAALSPLARRNEDVVLTIDPKTPMFDKAGRLLAYVTGSDRRLMQTEMLRLGYARASTAKPRITRYSSFVNAHRKAKKAKKALWRTCGGNFSKRR